MKDNMENFREISDEVLKDIYVSDDLKSKTLKKCTNKRNKKIKPVILSTASAAVLLIAFGLSNYFFHYPIIAINDQTTNEIKNEDKKPADDGGSISSRIIAKIKPDADGRNLFKNEKSPSTDKALEQNTESANKATDTKSINNTNTLLDSTSKNNSDNSQYASSDLNNENPLTFTKQLSLTEAEKYFGSSVLIPRYVPAGFNLKSISIPEDKTNCIKLTYISKTAYFELFENKNISELEGSKTISIGKNKAYVNYDKDENATAVTSITWLMNNTQYTLVGNLPESFLINIAKSIN